MNIVPTSINFSSRHISSHNKKKSRLNVLTAGIPATLLLGAAVFSLPSLLEYGNKVTGVSAKELKVVKNAANQVANNKPFSYLKTKIQFKWLSNEEFKKIWKKTLFKKPKNFKDLSNKAITFAKSMPNAIYQPLGNKININGDMFTLGVFHELGHAYNRYSSRLSHYLHKTAFIFPVAFVTGLYSIIATKPKHNNKKENFVLKNKEAIIGAAYIPLLIEETRATVNGLKLAKKVLPENLYKKSQKVLPLGLITYATAPFVIIRVVNKFCKFRELPKDEQKQKIKDFFLIKKKTKKDA